VSLIRLFCFVALAGTLGAQPDGAEIVRQSLARSEERARLARNYTFIERQVQKRLDAEGRVKSRQCRTFDITLLEGSPYRRLIQRDDRPLPPEEEKKEQEKLERSIAERRNETEKQRASRIADWERKRKRQRDLAAEVVKAFDLKVVGEESVEGRPAWVLEATPRHGYKPPFREARMLPKLKGRIWIDREDLEWVRMEADLIDTVSFGWLLARVQPGGHLSLTQTRVNNEVWLPRHVKVTGAARIALVKMMRIEVETEFSDFRKFQSESRVVSTSPL